MKSTPPLVSVITIFLDPGVFFVEAVESVLAQTYPYWELILVDDGTTDGTSEQALAFAAAYPNRIRYLDHAGHANLGMSASRNLGLAHAQGHYVAFLDADDTWLPDKLDIQVQLLEGLPEVGMACAATQYWYSWTDGGGADQVIPVGAPQDIAVAPPQLAEQLYPLGAGDAPCMSSLLVRRKVVDDVGGFECMFKGMFEDQAFLIKVYLKTPAYIDSSVTDRYRQHSRSCMARAQRDGRYEAEWLAYLTWLEGYLDRQQLLRTKAGHLLRRHLWPYRYPRLARLRKRMSALARRCGRRRYRRAL